MSLDVFKNHGKILMLALDHRQSFKKYVNPNNPDKAKDKDIIAVKKDIVESVSNLMSGALVDPDWGLQAMKNSSAPYLLCMEASGYTDVAGERNTELKYSAKEIKMLGAKGAKLLLYMNPWGGNVESQVQVAKKAALDAKKEGLPFFLEIVTYGEKADGGHRAEAILLSIMALNNAGVIPDVYKLEYPGSPEDCEHITARLGKIPWILLTRGESYGIFRNQLRAAVRAGAIGFLAGRAVWQEIADYASGHDREKFLREIVRARFKEICEIVRLHS